MQTALPTHSQTSVAQPLRPLGAFAQTLSGKVTLTVAASLFVAASAHLSVPLPFTPVPLTFSDLAVVLVGLALSPSVAFAALALYLAEGALGAPVFSPYGMPGIARFASHTAGYLFAYPVAAALVSLLRTHLSGIAPRFLAGLTAAAAGSSLIMLFGTAWLVFFFHLAPGVAFALAAAPFLASQCIKIVAAAGIFAAFRHKA